MHLKTLNEAGRITLKDYPEAECREILIERNSYVLRKEHSYGCDYGGSQCRDEREVTYEEIIPERILVKDGHFCGVCICTEYEESNGGFKNYLKEVCLLRDGTGNRSARSGIDFANDDHSRWDYTDYYLVKREESE